MDDSTKKALKALWEGLDRPATNVFPPKRRRRRKPELRIQGRIGIWLEQQGAQVAVTDAGLLQKMGLYMTCGIPKGWPDLTVCLPGGKFLGVEVKSPKGRQTADQKECQKRIEAIGGAYVLAHSLAEAQEKITPLLAK